MVTGKQMHRYMRHIELCGVDIEGQQKLLNAKVLLVGAGGLGCPVALYLAAAGVGNITVIDDDEISLSNLQRQILYYESDVQQTKVKILQNRLQQLNSECKINPIVDRLTERNGADLVSGHDIVIDGSDNFSTRYLLNELCHQSGKTLISGAILQFDGQVYVFKSAHTNDNGPCYQCLYPHKPTSSDVPSCTESAVLGPVAGVIGTMMAAEATKEILQVGESLAGSFLLYSSLDSTIRKIRFEKNNLCSTCRVS